MVMSQAVLASQRFRIFQIIGGHAGVLWKLANGLGFIGIFSLLFVLRMYFAHSVT